MKKFLTLFVIAMTITFGIYAQKAIQTHKFFDNTYVGISGTATTPLDFNNVFPINTGASLLFGKDLTPIFGLQLEGNVWIGSHSIFNHWDLDHNGIRGLNVGLNNRINLSNAIWGYNLKPRHVELLTVVGAGWFHTFNANTKDFNDLSAKTGMELDFNLGKSRASTLFLQPAVLWNLTASPNNSVQFNRNNAQLALSIGYLYHFKTSNGTHYFKVFDVGALNKEINSLRAENDSLIRNKETKIIENTIIKETVKNVEVGNTVVFFAKKSSVLSKEAKETLDKVIGPVDVIGYASPEGTAAFNKALSEARANTVAKYLSSKGVKVNSHKGLGVQNKTSNRVVIVIKK